MSRRSFLKLTGTAVAAGTVLHPRNAQTFVGRYATIIDLTRCDGCADEPVPRCVKACRDKNSSRFPEPVEKIEPYWPHKFNEDWSKKRDVVDTLQPYNWLFVQKTEVQGRTQFIPRRCMHCDNPPCVSLCPFGAMSKEKPGNTVISAALCFGGAKCRDVCPWKVPQRQAGVGLYLSIMPKYAGGGVMYKCDLCNDRVKAGRTPACVEACNDRLHERTAMFFGPREELVKTAKNRAVEEGLHIYGLKENGGTSTIYLSRYPFTETDNSLKAKKARFEMPVNVPNPLEESHSLASLFVGGTVAAAVAGIAGAVFARRKREEGKHEDSAPQRD